MEYVGEDGVRHQPIMIHRALFGSVERFIGVLIENYAGDFPLWLAPVQLRLIAVSDGQIEYAEQVVAKFKAAGIRVQLDHSGDRMAKQIRKAELEKVPVMAVIGAKEVEAGTLSIRSRKHGELGAISVDEAISKMQQAIGDRTWF
jgi:threonyl-tRNA synthetase